MKNLSVLIAIFFSITNTYAQTSINFSPPVTVAPSTFDNVRPRISLTTNNNPIIMWGRGNNKKIFTARFNGSSFDAPAIHTPGTFQAFVTDWASAEMAASGDTVFVVYKSEPALTGGIYLTRSTDGGITFTDTIRIDDIEPNISRFSNVSIGTGGNPVVTFMIFEPAWLDPQYAVINSTDGGNTFLPEVVATSTAPGEACDCCPASLTIKDDKQVVLFRNNIGNLRNMWGVLSADGGLNFSTAGEIDQTNWNLNVCPSSGPTGFIFGDSMVYTWMSGASGGYRVYSGTVNLNNWQVGSNQMIAPGINSQNMPRIAGNADTLAVVWEQINGITDLILMSWSVTGPAGLGINTDTIASSTINLINPDIAFADGVFHISYQDDASNTVLYKTGTVTTSTNIIELNKINSLSIYPNPSTTEITLESNQVVTNITITYQDGKLIRKISADNKIVTIATNDLSPGIYFLNAITKDGEEFKKQFIIK